MKWVQKDIEMFEQVREHIDTVLVPLIGINFDSHMTQYAQMNEFTSILTAEIERQYKGRIILLPPFTYINGMDLKTKKQLTLQWKKYFINEGFKHVFFITSDSDWKEVEKQFEDSLIWIPSIPLEGLDDLYKRQIMDGQVMQISNIFSQKWLQEK